MRKLYTSLLLLIACTSTGLAFAETEKNAETDNDASEESESPWFATPTISSNPKLGSNIGAMAGYLIKFDEQSTPSMVAIMGNYSTTDSWTTGLFGQFFFDENRQRLSLAHFTGEIHNDYNDYLGSGLNIETTDRFNGNFLRYLHNVYGPHWFIGAQVTHSNYTMYIDDFPSAMPKDFGAVGFDSVGAGLVLEFNNTDNQRNATRGQRLVIHNFAYRESLGSDDSYDGYNLNYNYYLPHADGNVLAIDVKNRWTKDAPFAAYSSVSLRGYTRGNYLNKHYSHIDLDERYPLTDRWGLAAFAGLACLYDSTSDCSDSENLLPAAGIGATYTLKKAAGLVIRSDIAIGKGENEGFYLKIGQPF